MNIPPCKLIFFSRNTRMYEFSEDVSSSPEPRPVPPTPIERESPSYRKQMSNVISLLRECPRMYVLLVLIVLITIEIGYMSFKPQATDETSQKLNATRHLLFNILSKIDHSSIDHVSWIPNPTGSNHTLEYDTDLTL